MVIGILSDSHGHSEQLEAALKILLEQGAETIVHCGDLESSSDMALLGKLPVPVIFSLGNMDRHNTLELQQQAKRWGVQVAEDFVTLKIDKETFLAATHGHKDRLLDELILGRQFTYVCYGHSHQHRDQFINEVRVLNPGALHRSRDKAPSVMLLDTNTETVKLIEL